MTRPGGSRVANATWLWIPKVKSTGPMSRTSDGALDVIVEFLCKVPQVSRLCADGGHAGPKLRDALAGPGVSELIEIVENPKRIRGFTVLYRRWVVEWTFVWMGRCRRLANSTLTTASSAIIPQEEVRSWSS